MELRTAMVALPTAGEDAMYERMLALARPGRHSAAILFADLEASGELSRRLPTARFFELIRVLSTRFDHAVSANLGIVGKHAGDGMTAFFATDCGPGPADVAGGALRTAHEVQQWAGELGATLGGYDVDLRMNIALHWGANLYMGQVVPWGPLDVTALGDEVTECARLEESTHGGRIAVSKALLELLDEDDAAEFGVDAMNVVYEPLGRVPGVSAKAVRDAGTLAVAYL